MILGIAIGIGVGAGPAAGLSGTYNVLDYGAFGTAQHVNDGMMRAGSDELTSASASFDSRDLGQPISVLGAATQTVDGLSNVSGAPLITTITNVLDAHTVNVAAAATASVTNASVSVGPDDTAAVQNLINRVGATGGGTIYFPAGFYQLSSSGGNPALTVRSSNIRLSGDGAASTVLFNSTILFGAKQVEGVTYTNQQGIPVLYVNAGDSSAPANISNVEIDHLTLQDNGQAYDYGVFGPEGPGVLGSQTWPDNISTIDSLSFHDLTINTNYLVGINIDSAGNSYAIYNTVINGNGNHLIYAAGSVTNGNIYNNQLLGGSGIIGTDGPRIGIAVKEDNLSITNNHIDHVQFAGILLGESPNISVSNISITNNQLTNLTPAGTSAVFVSWAQQVTISNNRISNISGTAFLLWTAERISEVSIQNNIITAAAGGISVRTTSNSGGTAIDNIRYESNTVQTSGNNISVESVGGTNYWDSNQLTNVSSGGSAAYEIAASAAGAVNYVYLNTEAGYEGTSSCDFSCIFTAPTPPQSPAVISVNPQALSFGSDTVGSAAAAQFVTITNVGTVPVTFTSMTVTPADFSVTSNTCGTTLQAGYECTLSVTFDPIAAGARTGSLAMVDSATSTEAVALSGTGTMMSAVASPSNLNFGSQTVGVVSPTEMITLSNTGSAALPLTTIAVGGQDSPEFQISGTNCSSSLAPGNSCTIAVTFWPTASGAHSASVTIASLPLNWSQSVSITGTGSAYETVAGSLASVAVGGDGTVWGLNDLGQIFAWNAQNQGWQQIPGTLSRLALGSSTSIWGLNPLGQIYSWNVTGQAWDEIAGSLVQLAVGGDGDTWGINRQQQVFHFSRLTTNWQYVAGTLTQISVGFAGAVWGLGPTGVPYRYDAGSARFDQLPGQFTSISVGMDGDVWAQNDAQTYHFNRLLQTWEAVAGDVKTVSVGGNGNVWAIDKSGNVFEFLPSTGTWVAAGGILAQLSVAQNGAVWGVSGTRQICRYQTGSSVAGFHPLSGHVSSMAVAADGSAWALDTSGAIYAFDPLRQNWTNILGNLAQIAVGPGGRVWGLNAAEQIFRYDVTAQTWDWIPGSLARIAVAANGDVWGINDDDQTYRFDASRQDWTWIPGELRQLTVGADGSVWGVNRNQQIYQFDATDGRWENVPGSLVQVDAGSASAVWGINAEGQVYRRESNDSGWELIPGKLDRIAVGFDGSVLGLAGTTVYRFDPNSETFSPIPGAFQAIAVAAGAVIWAIDSSGIPHRYW
ncbi:MAG TPA: tectonin domain-containing protein [Bryobacteraceae bacterium]|nr:tectonin domain-containing protein [Bryobacteraceae bacterium]